MSKRDNEVVIRRLTGLLNEIPSNKQTEKVYHEGFVSYGWKDLISEIESNSEFGRRYVTTLQDQAKAEHVSLKKFLDQALP